MTVCKAKVRLGNEKTVIELWRESSAMPRSAAERRTLVEKQAKIDDQSY
jgi:hypothetical protein